MIDSRLRKKVADQVFALVGVVVVSLSGVVWMRLDPRNMACAISIPLTREIQWDPVAKAFKEVGLGARAGHVLLIVNGGGSSKSFRVNCPSIRDATILAHRDSASVALIGKTIPNGQLWNNRLRLDAVQVDADSEVPLVLLGDVNTGIGKPQIYNGKYVVRDGEIVPTGVMMIWLGSALLVGCSIPMLWRIIRDFFRAGSKQLASEDSGDPKGPGHDDPVTNPK